MDATAAPSEPSITSFKPAVDRALEQLLAAAILQARDIDEVYVTLLMAIRDTLLAGGKRLRPYLSYLAYTGLGGAEDRAFLPVAASQELLHHFLLIHDDIIDRDFTRHGVPNVEGRYRQHFTRLNLPPAEALHYAESFALLAGNAACTLGLQAITDADFAPELKLSALQCAHRMLFEIMGGELMDVDASLPGGRITPDRLLSIAHYKTATYSFQTPLQLGAILAGASAPVQSQLRDFGHQLGLAFQLTDDLLGVYGDEAMLGKPVTSDLREGKQTLLIHHAFAAATPTQARTLRRLWGRRSATAADLSTVRGIIQDCGARAQTAALAGSHLQAGLSVLASIPIAPAVQAELARLARFSVQREY